MNPGRTAGGPPDPQPCSHMRNLVSSLSDGSIGRLAGWYTRLHVGGCPKCRTTLEAFLSLRVRLKSFELAANPSQETSLTADRRSNIETALDRIEHERQDSLS